MKEKDSKASKAKEPITPEMFELSTLKLCLRLLEQNFSAHPEHLQAMEDMKKLIISKTTK
jgi:hypothetical protein